MSASFIDALLAAPTPVIMEIKRRGAHGEDLLRDRPLAEIVAAYHAVGAPCLSVVTGAWFGGNDALLHEVAALTDLPILKKDFITKDEQVAQAREMGASAVLLTARILPGSVLHRLTESCLRHGLTPFVEVSDLGELDGFALGGDCIVAVNNKDILQRERDAGDIDRSLALLSSVSRTGTRCPVSASGIGDPETAARLVDAGYKGLLIGTGLLLSEDLATWFDGFRRHRRVPETAL